MLCGFCCSSQVPDGPLRPTVTEASAAGRLRGSSRTRAGFPRAQGLGAGTSARESTRLSELVALIVFQAPPGGQGRISAGLSCGSTSLPGRQSPLSHLRVTGLSSSRGLILQDLTFVHLGNPDYIDGKVNFSKRWQQFNILDGMRCFQQA